MALQKTFDHPYYDITITNAYWVIDKNDGIRGNEEELEITLNAYTSQAAVSKDGITPIYRLNFKYTPSGNVDIITQIYNYAKTFPILVGATNV